MITSLKDSSAYRFVVRYKLYHILFWIGYQLFWEILFSSAYILGWPNILLIILLSVAQGIGVYANVYYFVPSFLKKGRYGIYALGFAGCFLVSSLLTAGSYHLVYYLLRGHWGVVGDWFVGNRMQFNVAMISMTFTAIIVVMIIKLVNDWLKSQQRTQQLEKEKLETELKFLRSQFNPHFLFNTINSIHFLIQKDPKMASDTLSKFSDLLRYQLYECNEAHISLKKEVHYLSNFVALEKLRVNDNVTVSLDVSENVNGAQIAPFILIPFVENAFKHLSKGRQQTHFIRIALQQDAQRLEFCIENSRETTSEPTREAVHYGGIGLTNVRRRLALLYPQQHALCIDEQDGIYSVHLTLDLHED